MKIVIRDCQGRIIHPGEVGYEYGMPCVVANAGIWKGKRNMEFEKNKIYKRALRMACHRIAVIIQEGRKEEAKCLIREASANHRPLKDYERVHIGELKKDLNIPKLTNRIYVGYLERAKKKVKKNEKGNHSSSADGRMLRDVPDQRQ